VVHVEPPAAVQLYREHPERLELPQPLERSLEIVRRHARLQKRSSSIGCN
jgi:hypothetical protein